MTPTKKRPAGRVSFSCGRCVDSLAAYEQNVWDNISALRAASPMLADAQTRGTLKTVGGVYRLVSGKVDLI
jgi:carbonic anhydrase